MATENLLYTDGRDVVVTDSTLRVRSRHYRVSGIIKHDFSIVKPNRTPGIFIFGIGLIALTIALNANLTVSNLTFHLSSGALESKALLAIGGSICAVIGFISLIATKEKYGVHIVTEEGEQNVLVSTKKEYVARVVAALNKAVGKTLADAEITGRNKLYPYIGMSVSHR